MGALYNYNGVETEASALFKNQFGRLEGSAKINLPIDGFRYYILWYIIQSRSCTYNWYYDYFLKLIFNQKVYQASTLHTKIEFLELVFFILFLTCSCHRNLEASFQHVGDLSSSFKSEARAGYENGEEISAKVDMMRASWRRLEFSASLNTPFENFENTMAEYKHSASGGEWTASWTVFT